MLMCANIDQLPNVPRPVHARAQALACHHQSSTIMFKILAMSER